MKLNLRVVFQRERLSHGYDEQASWKRQRYKKKQIVAVKMADKSTVENQFQHWQPNTKTALLLRFWDTKKYNARRNGKL